MSREWSSVVRALALAGTAGLSALFPVRSEAREPRVVATIKPVHSLVAQVMAGIGTPGLLVDGAASPHTYSLRPSDARAVNDADILFRVSDALEPFSAKLVRSLPKPVEVVTLATAPGLKLLPRRTDASFEAHAQAQAGKRGHAHDHGHDAKSGSVDGHVWLDPDNAKLMVDEIAARLAARLPERAADLRANAGRAKAGIDALTAEIERELTPVAGRPYIVFHDAYQYFERRFAMPAAGSIAVSPETVPGAKRLTDLRRKIAALGATCVFSEPNFESRIVASVIEGTSARAGTLDPEGATVPAGPELYVTLMRKLASALRACLAT